MTPKPLGQHCTTKLMKQQLNEPAAHPQLDTKKTKSLATWSAYTSNILKHFLKTTQHNNHPWWNAKNSNMESTPITLLLLIPILCHQYLQLQKTYSPKNLDIDTFNIYHHYLKTTS